MKPERTRPTIVVLANHKGGSGKSTLAMHLLIALLKTGRRVGSLDLDYEQRSLTRYIENRVEWSAKNKVTLPTPDHRCVEGWGAAPDSGGSRISILTAALKLMERKHHDIILIDTAGGGGDLNLFTHSLADTLVTPINDSFVDLDVIDNLKPSSPNRYAAAVREALAARRAVTRARTDWVVVRNRLSPLQSRNQRDVLAALSKIASSAGFRVAPGLTERVAFRELFPIGLTVFDTLEAATVGFKPTISHLAARIEVRSLLDSLRLLQTQDFQPSPQHRDSVESPSLAPADPGEDFQKAIRVLLGEPPQD